MTATPQCPRQGGARPRHQRRGVADGDNSRTSYDRAESAQRAGCPSVCKLWRPWFGGASVSEEGWLARSTDGGATWTNLRDGPEFDSHTVYSMPDDEKVLISTSGKGAYRSEDGGDHFTPANDGLHSRYLAQVAFHPDAPQVLFTAGAEVPPPRWRRAEGCRSEIYRSENLSSSAKRPPSAGSANRGSPRATPLKTIFSASQRSP